MNSPDRRREREDLKAALSDPGRIAERLGLQGIRRQARGITARCPIHDDQHNSLSVVTAEGGGLMAVCHAGCFKGDELNLVAAIERLDITRDFPAVLERAREIAGTPAAQEPAPVRAPSVDAAALWASFPAVDADGWDFLRDRDLDGAADLCRSVPQVGAGPLVGMRIAVAMRDRHGQIVAIQARNLERAHDFRVAGPSGAGLFGDPSRIASPAVRFVFLVEGLTDYLAASIAIGPANDKAVVLGFAGVSNVAATKALPWKGKRVIVATDADKAGDDCARDLIATVGAAGAVAVRARPEGHKDLAAMREAGVDLRAWLGKATKIDLGFRPFGVRVEAERAARMADAGKALPFGVRYLDRALGGIVPRDVNLIGAESGMGKTELVTIIAMTCAAANKRVHYFALEPEPMEIERRIKFKALSLKVHGRHLFGVERFNYQDWHGGLCDDLSGPFEADADRLLAAQYENLHTFYRSEMGDAFTAVDFERMARALGNDSDLNILDHVHYFDDDEDQNRGQRRAARQFRDLAVSTGVPLIEVAHLRKKPGGGNRKGQRLIPERDDFEGSSHLFKPVKKAILLAPAREQRNPAPWIWPTYMAVVKNTLDGSRCRYVGLVDFNARTNSYEEPYVLGELVKNGEKWKAVDEPAIPAWARS